MEDFDIKEFARMFDAALASDNPAVKKALRNFLMVVAIVDSENTDAPNGPFASVLDEVVSLRQRVNLLESKNNVYNGRSWQLNNPITNTYNPYNGISSTYTTSSTGSITSKTQSYEEILDLIQKHTKATNTYVGTYDNLEDYFKEDDGN